MSRIKLNIAEHDTKPEAENEDELNEKVEAVPENVSQIDLVLNQVQHFMNTGTKKINFSFEGLKFTKTSTGLFMYCHVCGLKLSAPEFRGHMWSEHTEMFQSKDEKSFLKRVKTLIKRCETMKPKKLESTEKNKNGDPRNTRKYFGKTGIQVTENMTEYEINARKEYFKKYVRFNPNVDYNYDEVPRYKSDKYRRTWNRKLKDKYYLKKFITCTKCGFFLPKKQLQEHLAIHETDQGKDKFSAKNLVKCNKCMRVCLKQGFIGHCCKEIIEYKRSLNSVLAKTRKKRKKEEPMVRVDKDGPVKPRPKRNLMMKKSFRN